MRSGGRWYHSEWAQLRGGGGGQEEGRQVMGRGMNMGVYRVGWNDIQRTMHNSPQSFPPSLSPDVSLVGVGGSIRLSLVGSFCLLLPLIS